MLEINLLSALAGPWLPPLHKVCTTHCCLPGQFLTASVLVLFCSALITVSLCLGYQLGAWTTTTSLPPTTFETQNAQVQEAEVDSDDDEDEELADGDLSTIKASFMEPCKLASHLKFWLRIYPSIFGSVERFLWCGQT